MNRTVQLYIKDVSKSLQRVDLFKDESISITDKIQDIRDISKVFTEFSQSFKLPASKTNNKLFKHYYNENIIDAFDARKRVDAEIEINNISFKKGKIRLEGVEMRNNRPYLYKVTFFGNTIKLKDILGDDELSELSFDASLNKTYDATNVKAGLQLNPSSNDVVVPLISHTQRLFYNSTTHVQNDGNLFYHTGSGTNFHGVVWDNLKYAIRIHKIVEAIQSKYDLTFSNDFFVSTNAPYYNLFMWLHRKKGDVEADTQVASFTKVVDGWVAEQDIQEVEMINTTTLRVNDGSRLTRLDLTITRNNTITYDIDIFKDGISVYSEGNITSTGTKVIDVRAAVGSFFEGDYTVQLTYQEAIAFTGFTWDATIEEVGESPIYANYGTGAFTAPSSFEFFISSQIPKMKVLTFITALFKMFNLTAFVEDDGTIYVDTLDEFYKDKESTPDGYDITEYVDSTKNTVDAALPYKEISFFYEDTDSLLAKKHREISGTEWAKEEYVRQELSNEKFDGEDYEVEVPFGHFKYERLLDLNDNSQTSIQWGYSADDDFDETTGNYGSYIGKPLLFYPILQSGGNSIQFIESSSVKDELTSYVIPSNSLALTDSSNINFKAELNEYTNTQFATTLFKQYYETYIAQVFTQSNRIKKVKAYLPLRILLSYTLADKFIYKGRKHQINSIKTNLMTGESEIELLNIVIE